MLIVIVVLEPLVWLLGKGSEQFIGTVTTSAASAQDNVTINVGTGGTRPYDGQIVYFDQLYKSVETITVTNGGSGYTSTPTVTLKAPTGPVVKHQLGRLLLKVVLLHQSQSSVVEVNMNQHLQLLFLVVVEVMLQLPNMADIYYTINSATPIVSGITTLTLDENLINTVGVGSTVFFFNK